MRFLTKKQVRELTTLSLPTIDRKRKDPLFPKRRTIGSRVVFVESEILTWMRTVADQEPATRDNPPTGELITFPRGK
jgi:predicted DNA-binding transcriptional regulator AlpA